MQFVKPCGKACHPGQREISVCSRMALYRSLKLFTKRGIMSMEPSNKSKTTKSITRMSRQGTTSSDEKTTTVVSSSHKRKTQTTKSPDSKTVQQTTLKEGTTIVVTSSHKSETTGTILSTKRPTQLSKIYVRQSDFEDSFMEDVRLRCDDIEKTLNDVLQACRKLIDKRL